MAEVHVGLFVTLSAYGTRIHGDPRGSVDRYHNGYGDPQLGPDAARARAEARRMNFPAAYFSAPIRAVIEAAIHDACTFRGWELVAINCRTNHVHAVIGTSCLRQAVVPRLKDRATRAVREKNLLRVGQPLWARGGSGRYLWNDRDIAGASLYVVEGQGNPLPGTRVWLDMD